MCLWHNRNVPSTSVPKLHSQSYYPHTWLTNHHPPPHQWTLPTISWTGGRREEGGSAEGEGKCHSGLTLGLHEPFFGISHRVGILSRILVQPSRPVHLPLLLGEKPHKPIGEKGDTCLLCSAANQHSFPQIESHPPSTSSETSSLLPQESHDFRLLLVNAI